jgi:hypothetical protein
VASVTRSTVLPGPISACEELWYDLGRRASIVPGFGHLVDADEHWPREGARVRWESVPGGRGLVVESCQRFVAREGQTCMVEDEKLRGTQEVAFRLRDDGDVEVKVKLKWRLKKEVAIPIVLDLVMVRRPMEEALRTTLYRYRIERLADLDDERTSRAQAP